MSLSITQQNVKGGDQALFVRDGRVVLMTFPLTMRALAQDMCLEGNDLDEEQYPALIKKYRAKVDAQEKLSATPAPGSTDAVMQRLKKRIAATQDEAEAKNNQKIAAALVEAVHAKSDAAPAQPKTYERVVTMPNITHGNEPVLVTGPVTVLGELLGAAREAEIVLAFRKGEFTKAKAELAEAEDAAYKAWEAFNKELRTSLPESTRVKGVIIGSDNFFEQIIRTAQQMGGEVS